MRTNVSAGLLMFRRRDSQLEVLLVHPGGPFFRKKDAGAWTIPKGEAAPDEDLLTRAEIEFREELGVSIGGDRVPLGWIRQKGGKTVHAWAFEGNLAEDFELKSILFDLEWPPRSGRTAQFPEIDRAHFFSMAEARERINSAQRELLDRLSALVEAGPF